MGKKQHKHNPAQPLTSNPAPEAAVADADASTPTSPSGATPPVTGGWWGALALALFGVLIYAGTFGHAFTLDDLHVVRDNPVLIEGDWFGALRSTYWPEHLQTGASNWRPLASLSWLTDRIGLGDPAGMSHTDVQAAWAFRHHVMNALLHGLIVLLCFPVARRLLGSVGAAWVAVALFALHPAHTEVVAPVVGRTDLLAGIGVLGMCAAFWRWRDGGGPLWLAAAVAAFGFGLGGKESAAPALLLLPLADVWLDRLPWRRLWGRPALAYLPFAAVALCYLIARTAVLGVNSLAHDQAATMGMWERVAFTGHNSWISAWLLALPVRFHHVITTVPSDAPFTYPTPAGVWLAIWPVMLLPLWFGWIALVRRAPLAAWCWVAVLLPWIPTSGLLPAAAGVSLRFLFISTAFAAIGVVAAGRVWWGGRPERTPAVLALAAVLGLTGLVVTVRRVPAWRDDGTFHAAVLAEVPGCYTSAYSRGAWIAGQGGSLEDARYWFQQAIAVAGTSDRSINARNNLATSYEFGPSRVRYGADADLERALAVYTETLQYKPDSATANINAAIVAEKLAARFVATPAKALPYRRRALGHFTRGAELQPGHPDAWMWHRQSAEIAMQLQLRDEARRHFRAAAAARVARWPAVVRLQGAAGGARVRTAAMHELTQALALDPSPAEAAALQAEWQAWRAR